MTRTEVGFTGGVCIIVWILLVLLLTLIGEPVFGQAPDKCGNYEPGPWVPADSLGIMFVSSGTDTLVVTPQDGGFWCKVRSQEYIKRDSIPTTPAAGWVEVTPDLQGYFDTMNDDSLRVFIWGEAVAPWYGVIDGLRGRNR